MKTEQIEFSETSTYEIQTPGNYPEENIKHTEHGESLESRIRNLIFMLQCIMMQYTKMTNKMQLCRIIYYALAALHVSSDIFAHYQEHLNCITASGITHVCRCRLAATYVYNTRRGNTV